MHNHVRNNFIHNMSEAAISTTSKSYKHPRWQEKWTKQHKVEDTMDIIQHLKQSLEILGVAVYLHNSNAWEPPPGEG